MSRFSKLVLVLISLCTAAVTHAEDPTSRPTTRTATSTDIELLRPVGQAATAPVIPETLPIDLKSRAADPAKDPLPFVAGSWTLSIVGDVQNFNDNPITKRYPIQKAMIQWLVAHKTARNIRCVLTTGDTTNHNFDAEWENAKKHFSFLDGQLPYVMVMGNHDYANFNRRVTKQNDYFKPSDNPLNDPAKGGILGGVFEKDRLDNAWYTFTVNGHSYIVIALEYSPRDAAVEWADKIVGAHPDKRAILITHAYLYEDDTRYDWSTYGDAQKYGPRGNDAPGRNDGEDLWQKLVRKHKNFIFVCCGHVLGDQLGYLASEGDHGNTVHQILFNRQRQSDGQLRLLEFLPDNKTVHVKTYNPVKDTWAQDGQNQYILDLAPTNDAPASRPAVTR